jgi:UPF0716 protein FxsA
VVELALLIKIGTFIGIFNTVILIIVTALVGAYMVKMEGLNVLYRFRENIVRGILPSEEFFDGILILIAGALLITPGILTDFMGFLFVFPPSRGIIKFWIKNYIKRRIESGNFHIYFGGF